MKHGIFHIIFLFLATSVYSQVSLVSFPDKKEVKENQRILFTIVLEIRGEDFVQESALKMPDLSKFITIGTSSNQHTLIDPTNGTRINQQIFYYVLDPKVTGTVKLGSALVQVSGKMYKSEPTDILVNPAERKKPVARNGDEVFLNMQVESRSIYPNQPTVAVLRGFSKDMASLRKFGEISVPKQKNVLINSIETNSDEIESEENDLASQVLAVYLIFPKNPGNVEIEPFSAEFGSGKNLRSNKVLLNVKKLPSQAPKNYKNAVGKFSFNIEKPDDSVEFQRGKAFPVSIVLKGNGNFNNLEIPKILPSENYHFFKPKITNRLVNSKKGIHGEKIATYLVVADKPGKINLQTENFVYFDTEKKKFEDLGFRNFEFEIPDSESGINEQKTAYEKINTITENVINQVKLPAIPEPMRRIKHKKNFPWHFTALVGIFSVLGFLSFLFVKKLKKKTAEKPQNLVPESKAFEPKKIPFSEIENKIQHLFGLLERKEYASYFIVFDETISEFKNSIQESENQSVGSYLEKHFGNREAENFAKIVSQINLEKSAPNHSDELLYKLTKDIQSLFARLKKSQ